jgi:hypothetical protein
MPFGDRTGPLGLGPRTGRAAGFCSGFGMPGYANPVPGGGWFGFGRGRGGGRGWFGGGRGWRHWYWATGLPGWARAGYGYPSFTGYGYPSFGASPYTPTAKEEMDILKDQSEFLKQQLGEIEDRIKTLEKAQAQESE